MKKSYAKLMVILLVLGMLCGCSIVKRPIGGTPPGKTLTPDTQKVAPSGQSVSGTGTLPTGTSAPIPTVKASSTETPAPKLKSQTGEIPQTQSFMYYSSVTGHYDVQVPEGWTAASDGENIKFTHSNNGVQVEIIHTNDPFTIDGITNKQVAALVQTGRAVSVKNISQITTKSGAAVRVEFESNSEPDSSGKKVRLENQQYYYHTEGKLAALTLWAPMGSANENIWTQIPDTFLWR